MEYILREMMFGFNILSDKYKPILVRLCPKSKLLNFDH